MATFSTPILFILGALPLLAGAQAGSSTAPVLSDCARPVYTRESVQRHESGTVRLKVQVDAQGKVTDTVVIGSTGFPALDKSARAAAVTCRYSPATADGTPVPGEAIWTFKFTIDHVEDAETQETYQRRAAQFLAEAQAGQAKAQYLLAELYRSGRGVDTDLAAAAGWYRKAALQGHVPASYNLAMFNLLGAGVDKNIPEAAVWMRKAADGGHADAQNRMGALFEDGNGVPQDQSQAAAWYLKAAEQGHVVAMYNTGQCLELGLGVTPDLAAAVKWYTRASNKGDKLAEQALAAIKAK